jgi:hypothetical protein
VFDVTGNSIGLQVSGERTRAKEEEREQERDARAALTTPASPPNTLAAQGAERFASALRRNPPRLRDFSFAQVVQQCVQQ